MKPIAILTMVYDDDIYLKIWLAYWERFVPRSNLYVLIHANHDHYEEMARGCNTIRIARPPVHVDLEADRWRMLSRLASSLTFMFERVIYTDVDEIIALDPKNGSDPVEHVLNRTEAVISPYGVDVVEPAELDLPPIDLSRPILSQRSFVCSSAPYSKPCITSEPINWSKGGHYSDKSEVFLSEDLVLFHLRLFDRGVYQERSANRRAMVTDPGTGKVIEGLGGPSWQRTNEFERYAIKASEPMKKIRFRKDRAKWLSSASQDEQGFWKRKGWLRKELHRIPKRFETVF